MPQAEGKTFDFDVPASIDVEVLETLPYDGNKQDIVYETNEFSAVCPYSGLPDFAYLKIKYIPVDRIVELKSLKYYIISYRNVGIYQEAATDKIFKDLMKCLEPEYMEITTVYNLRGGIKATCVMDSNKV